MSRLDPLHLLYALWLLWVVSWVLAAVWSARQVGRLPLRREVPSRVLVLAGAILMFSVGRRGLSWPEPESLRWLLVAVALGGLAFCWWARIHLGALWSAAVTKREGHRVIDTGPYRLVRHPIYTGVILAGFGTALAEGNAIAIAGALVMTAGWYLKARLEEGWLRTELGENDYDAYAARVPMLVPRLGRGTER